jgi:hypothetical protein
VLGKPAKGCLTFQLDEAQTENTSTKSMHLQMSWRVLHAFTLPWDRQEANFEEKAGMTAVIIAGKRDDFLACPGIIPLATMVPTTLAWLE